MPLTDIAIRALDIRERIYKRTDERGLYPRGASQRIEAMALRYRHQGKDKRLALGRYPEVGLADARRKRDDARMKLDGRHRSFGRAQAQEAARRVSPRTPLVTSRREYIDKMVAERRAVATITKANWLLDQLAPISKFPSATSSPWTCSRRSSGSRRRESTSLHAVADRLPAGCFDTVLQPAEPRLIRPRCFAVRLMTPKVKHHGAILEPESAR